jgi:hypothetical protein
MRGVWAGEHQIKWFWAKPQFVVASYDWVMGGRALGMLILIETSISGYMLWSMMDRRPSCTVIFTETSIFGHDLWVGNGRDTIGYTETPIFGNMLWVGDGWGTLICTETSIFGNMLLAGDGWETMMDTDFDWDLNYCEHTVSGQWVRDHDGHWFSLRPQFLATHYEWAMGGRPW